MCSAPVPDSRSREIESLTGARNSSPSWTLFDKADSALMPEDMSTDRSVQKRRRSDLRPKSWDGSEGNLAKTNVMTNEVAETRGSNMGGKAANMNGQRDSSSDETTHSEYLLSNGQEVIAHRSPFRNEV